MQACHGLQFSGRRSPAQQPSRRPQANARPSSRHSNVHCCSPCALRPCRDPGQGMTLFLSLARGHLYPQEALVGPTASQGYTWTQLFTISPTPLSGPQKQFKRPSLYCDAPQMPNSNPQVPTETTAGTKELPVPKQ